MLRTLRHVSRDQRRFGALEKCEYPSDAFLNIKKEGFEPLQNAEILRYV